VANYRVRFYDGPSASAFRDLGLIDLPEDRAADINRAFQGGGLPFRLWGETKEQAVLRRAAEGKDAEERERIRAIVRIVLEEQAAAGRAEAGQ
jgi:hypothetical protein